MHEVIGSKVLLLSMVFANFGSNQFELVMVENDIKYMPERIRDISRFLVSQEMNITVIEYYQGLEKTDEVWKYDFMVNSVNNTILVAILDQNKLFYKGDRFQLRSVINILINKYKQIQWPNDLNRLTLLEIKDIMEELEEIESIHVNAGFKKVRNTIIAHSDKNHGIIALPLHSLREIHDRVKNIVKRISQPFLNETYFIQDSGGIPRHIHSSISKYALLRDLYFEKSRVNQNSIPLGEIEKILFSS